MKRHIKIEGDLNCNDGMPIVISMDDGLNKLLGDGFVNGMIKSL